MFIEIHMNPWKAHISAYLLVRNIQKCFKLWERWMQMYYSAVCSSSTRVHGIKTREEDLCGWSATTTTRATAPASAASSRSKFICTFDAKIVAIFVKSRRAERLWRTCKTLHTLHTLCTVSNNQKCMIVIIVNVTWSVYIFYNTLNTFLHTKKKETTQEINVARAKKKCNHCWGWHSVEDLASGLCALLNFIRVLFSLRHLRILAILSIFVLYQYSNNCKIKSTA